jgi:maleate cis-trans isomerase
MFGWRKRIGYITPSVMETAAYEFYKFAPEGVGLVSVSCNIEDWKSEEYERGLSQADTRADDLASRAVDFIIHGGGPLVFSRGKGYDQEIVNHLVKRTGVPSTTTIKAAVDGMFHLNAKNVAVASIYPDETNAKLGRFLSDYGFKVSKLANQPTDFKRIYSVPMADIYRFAVDTLKSAPDADVLYMPCPQWPVCDVIDIIERDTGRPVVASTAANFFAAFSHLGIRDKIVGHGALLKSLSD